MLKQHEVEWVKQLAKQGLSRRKIALQTGFARDTVRKILDGQRPDYEAIRREKGCLDEPLFTGPIERCPTCGGRVYMPCIACRVRAHGPIKAPPVVANADDLVALRRRKIAEFRQERETDRDVRRRAA